MPRTWSYRINDLTENVKIQDQTFSPDELAILLVIYDAQPELISGKQKELLDRVISAGTVPSRRQYETAKACRGILKDVKGPVH